MRRFALGFAVLLATCTAGHAQGDKGNVIVGFDFEKTSKPWTTMDPEGQVGLTGDPEHVRAGAGALEFKYTQRAPGNGAQGMPGSLMGPIEGGLNDVKSVHLSVKAVRQMPLVVGLNEAGGATYTSAVWVPADKWLDLDLPVSGFSQGLDDQHRDPRGHLDLDQVTAIILIDATPFLYALAQSGAIPVSKPTFGEQILWVDEVNFMGDAPPVEKPAHPVAGGEPTMIDSCRHKFAQWVVLGGNDPSISESPDAADGPGLRVAYRNAPGTIIAMFHQFAPGLLQGAKQVDISLKSTADCTFALMFEQIIEPKPATGDGKARFAHPVELKAADGWKRFSLPLTEFKQDEKEAPVPMNPARFSSIILVDFTAVATQQPVTNVLQVDDIVGVK